MAAFLDGYEGNKERTDRWIKTYPEGRLEATIVNFDADKGSILVRAAAWRNQTEIEPAGIDFAYGYQAAYNANMKRWFVEDTVTSALMRVMALVMGGTEKATKETMEKVNAADVYDPWTTKHGDVPSYKTSAEAEQSGTPSFGSSDEPDWSIRAKITCLHGEMRWNQSKPEAAKSWGGYFCTEKVKAMQCTPRWYVLRSTGNWEPQV
jgi:hypothetical protein